MDPERKRLYNSHGTGMFEREQFRFLGENVVLENHVLVFHPENISIGHNVYIGHYTILKGYFKNEMISGEGSWIGQNCYFHSAGGIEIGKDVGIGPCVKIISSYHMEKSIDLPLLHNPLEFAKVTIGDGADIGVGTVILPGISIGEGAIVGAGSVVTKNISPFTVYAGNPARPLRKRKGL